MTEQERMLSGNLYHPGDEALSAARDRAKKLTWRYNQIDPTDWAGRTALLGELLGCLGEDSWIEPSFRCDYGVNITVGDGVFVNYDCIFLDVAPITIGSRVLIAPRVCLYTAGHPTDAEVRSSGLEFGLPITVEDDAWIGGSAVILPGVTIGSGSIIAAGSVVTKDIPAGVIAAGNPCRVLRPITDDDRNMWEARRQEYLHSKERSQAGSKAAPGGNTAGSGVTDNGSR